MPAITTDKLRQVEADLKQQIASAGDAMTDERRRELRKALRRAQRRRRRNEASAAKHAPKPKAADGDAGGES